MELKLEHLPEAGARSFYDAGSFDRSPLSMDSLKS